ncbi:SDR family oxidoreductase [Streptomyces sp. NPDC048484]|uniref:SDR family oxidoreductase n=1 Tax=Streptomyces sp. NPDC048484 TaxID=3155146 RepID=UPI0034221838
MRVALTGATGFLGLRLVRQLLRQHDSLTVLVRAGSGCGLRRIARFMKLSGTPASLIADLPRRLRVVEIDLCQPELGLSGGAFRRLADELDVIWHCAGNINLDDDLGCLRRTRATAMVSIVLPGLTGTRSESLADYARQVSLTSHVRRVDTATGSYAGGRRFAPPVPSSARFSGAHGQWLSVVTDAEPFSVEGGELVHALRAVRAPVPAGGR